MSEESIQKTSSDPRVTNTITARVAERVASISTNVNDKVVDVLVARELDKRSDAIVASIDTLTGFKRDLQKIRPDVGGAYNEDGTEIKPSLFSKAKFEERKKLLEKIEKYEKDLDLAIDKGDMSKLYDLKKD